VLIAMLGQYSAASQSTASCIVPIHTYPSVLSFCLSVWHPSGLLDGVAPDPREPAAVGRLQRLPHLLAGRAEPGETRVAMSVRDCATFETVLQPYLSEKSGYNLVTVLARNRLSIVMWTSALPYVLLLCE
jgi:hypothetical protein